MIKNKLYLNGGAEGDRTPDLNAASVALSQLSYSPCFIKSFLCFIKSKVVKNNFILKDWLLCCYIACMSAFYLFRKYFLSSRSTSLIRMVAWICLLGLAVSVASLILIVSIMGGFGEAITSRLLTHEPHLIVHLKGDASERQNDEREILLFQLGVHGERLKSESGMKFDDGVVSVEQNPEIDKVNFVEMQELIVKTESGFIPVVAQGYSFKDFQDKKEQVERQALNYKFGLLEKTEAQTSLPTHASGEMEIQEGEDREIFVNDNLFYELGQELGSEAVLVPLMAFLLPPSLLPPVKKIKVKGVVEQRSNAKTQNLELYYRQGGLDFGRYSPLKYQAQIWFKDLKFYKKYQNLLSNFETSSWVERNSTLFFALKLEKFIMILFIVLAIIISCLGVSSALFLLITQKGQDIGIFHAMGLSQKKLVQVFVRMGFYLASLGILLGAFFGIIGTAFFKYNKFNILPEMYQDRTIPAIFDPVSYAFVILGAFLLAWLVCYFPTKYLSRINLVELLKITRH